MYSFRKLQTVDYALTTPYFMSAVTTSYFMSHPYSALLHDSAVTAPYFMSHPYSALLHVPPLQRPSEHTPCRTVTSFLLHITAPYTYGKNPVDYYCTYLKLVDPCDMSFASCTLRRSAVMDLEGG
ncbi:Hypp2958 [Branchiostoma lanceolatum]|uniref:Hypp2958 protein n=1 Tax=Branchiostoma lanceolatum TaxID=7740 RepID=A0A8J9ZY42_BRALA|nr:Hypp2958 [Branchiostoma lanceolatum]